MSRRLKVLICAYTCSPYRGSEFAVGWGYVSALADRHDLWVILEEEKCKADIERFRASNPDTLKSVHFFFIHKRRNRQLRRMWPPSYYWYYRRWHKDAYRLAQRLHEEVGFDLVHQLTMVGFREPGYLWSLGIPFVWGPVGGMGLFPWRFLWIAGRYGTLYYLGYNLFNWLHMNLLSRPRLAARVAASGSVNGLIMATAENRNGAFRYWGCASTVLSEVGLAQEPVLQIRERVCGEPLRLVWSGAHVPRKALNLALLALSRLPANMNWQLDILGKGQQTVPWQRLAEKLNINSRCHFHGWISRKRALAVMRKAHIALITSLRDLTSTVTVEALALGLPIVCLDHCGFADVVNEHCGVKIPVTVSHEVVEAIRQAIEFLGRNEKRRQSLACGSLERARTFNWIDKAQVVDRIYQAKVGEQRRR